MIAYIEQFINVFSLCTGICGNAYWRFSTFIIKSVLQNDNKNSYKIRQAASNSFYFLNFKYNAATVKTGQTWFDCAHLILLCASCEPVGIGILSFEHRAEWILSSKIEIIVIFTL